MKIEDHLFLHHPEGSLMDFECKGVDCELAFKSLYHQNIEKLLGQVI